MTEQKKQFIQEYINKLNDQLIAYQEAEPDIFKQCEDDLFDIIIEISNIFANDLPHIKDSILLHNDTAERDADTVLGILKLFLINDDSSVKNTLPKHKDDSKENKKIFISHRSTDKKIADIFETFLTTCGIPYNQIFCSSLPGNDVEKEISREIKNSLTTSILNIVMLSAEFYKSAYCQNECGIIWFLDVDKIVIALPEIDENLMEGFLDNEFKIRRLNNRSDILAICDIVKKKFPQFITSNTKLNENIEKLQIQYNEILKDRVIDISYNNAVTNNELNHKILSGEFSDDELIILKHLYETQKRTLNNDLLEIRSWLNTNNIENIKIENAIDLLVEDNLMENVVDVFSQTSQFALTIKTYRELRKISQEALNIFNKCMNNHIVNSKEVKSTNEIDNLIVKGFTDVEILLIKYIQDLGRENLYYGWQSNMETDMIQNWEQINNLNDNLSRNYSNAVNKLEIRKFIEPCAKTSYGNTKEFKIKDTFLELLKCINTTAAQKIEEIVKQNQLDDLDSLPF